MTATVHMRMRQAPGTLVRTLGLVERRGFRTEEVSAFASPDVDYLDVVLRVSGGRPSWMLASQLRKLVDVQLLEVDDENGGP